MPEAPGRGAGHATPDGGAGRASPLARYLLAAWLLLVLYASLHPLSGWQDRGAAAWAFLDAPLPRYVTGFDLAANFLAYLPLGLLSVMALHPRLRGAAAVVVATLAGAGLSLSVEALQGFLPSRIPSNLDAALNAAGTLAGAVLGAVYTRRLLAGRGLHGLRHRLFQPGGHIDLGLVLLALWLFTQLTPETLLFGNGDLRDWFTDGPPGALHPAQVFIRAEAAVAACNALAIGLLVTCLAAPGQPARALVLVTFAAAFAVRSIAFGVLGSTDPLAWLTPGAAFGAAAGVVGAIATTGLPRAWRIAIAGLALMAATAIVNLSPENPYNAATQAMWRQGHFLNFNGLTRLVSMLWPFAALAYLMRLAGPRAPV